LRISHHPLKKKPVPSDIDIVDELVKEFLNESRENLDRLDTNLVELEKSPGDQELLADIFRTIHSIKGTTGFFGFHRLESLAHAGENLLARVRDGDLLLNPAITTILLETVDAIREMLATIETTGSDGETDYSSLIARIASLQETQSPPESTCAVQPEPPAKKGRRKPFSRTKSVAKLPQSSASQAQTCEPGPAEPKTAPTLEKRSAEIPHESGEADSAIRVDVPLLDRLMDLMGELVLTRNQIIQMVAGQQDSALLAASQRLNLVTSEMRETVMKTRLQPIQNVLGRFPRLVRDLALACGKRVRIETYGQDTELDRTLLEAIRDPLTHAVRNAVDHGIEAPDVRAAAGKPPEGCVTLRAQHEGGFVHIEISDDGRGIDPDAIRRKAIERGFITSDQADRMRPEDLVQLVFEAGFSTAEKVTNISGRGVGMDVVKAKIGSIGGSVDLHSILGQGATLRMKIPLTLAIIPALIVQSARLRFAIPQVHLLELLRLEYEGAQRAIEMVHGVPVYRLRGDLLPLVFLRRELHQSDEGVRYDKNGYPWFADSLTITVLQVEGRQFGLVVDEVHDCEEIVVKPLGRHLKGIPAFAGATVMGDGGVALILDITGLAQGAQLFDEPRTSAARSISNTTVDENAGHTQKQELLLFLTANNRRTAVALNHIERLEEFHASQFERAGLKLVVQYRGELLPIVNLSEQTDLIRESGRDSSVQVLVCRHKGEPLGVVVDQILDVVEEPVCMEERWKDTLSAGSAVIQERVTDFVELETMLNSANGQGPFAYRFEDGEIAP
jgi:two-component system chemotaxis sensor kinase CheA